METVLITGAGSGIGKATALDLQGQGYYVLATTETTEQAQQFQQESTEEQRSNLDIFPLDITSPQEREQVKNYDIDIVIHNAGVGYTGSLADIPVSYIRHNFEVNLFAIFELNALILPQLIAKDVGKIIAISSIAGRIPLPFFGAYNMTKHALSVGMYDLRAELKRLGSNVSVSVIEPGAYHTGFNQAMIQSRQEWMSESAVTKTFEPQLTQSQLDQFEKFETQRLNGLVRCIRKTVQRSQPRFRVSAPWWQAWGVHILRIMGI